jgi:hypothetical protein
LPNSSITYWKPVVKDWQEIEGRVVQLTGPWECPKCNGHVMLDYTFYEHTGGCVESDSDPEVELQYEGQEYCFCPYCHTKLNYPKDWPEQKEVAK